MDEGPIGCIERSEELADALHVAQLERDDLRVHRASRWLSSHDAIAGMLWRWAVRPTISPAWPPRSSVSVPLPSPTRPVSGVVAAGGTTKSASPTMLWNGTRM